MTIQTLAANELSCVTGGTSNKAQKEQLALLTTNLTSALDSLKQTTQTDAATTSTTMMLAMMMMQRQG